MELFKIFGTVEIDSKEAEKGLSKVESSAKKSEDGLGSLKKGAMAVGAGLVGLGIEAVKALAVKTFNACMEADKAMTKLKMSTNATKDELKILEKGARDLYDKGYGESLDDTTTAMQKVRRLGALTAGDYETLTKQALLISDAFGIDVADSTKTANKLMKNFGLTASESFEMISQGVKLGLDENGEYLDTLQEYGPDFKSMGFSAQQMGNLLVTAMDNGAWSVDKVGDAVREFSNTTTDGSKSTREAFESMGLDGDKMAQRIVVGGQSAQTAFALTLQKLAEMKDPIAQNIAGVALFGGMWEELGPKVILAMSSSKVAIDTTKTSIDQMNAVKLDSLETSWSTTMRLMDGELSIFSGKIKWVLDWFNSTAFPWLSNMGATFRSLASVMWDSLVYNFQQLIPRLQSIGGGILGVFTSLGSKLSSVFSSIPNYFGSALGGVLSRINSFSSKINSTLGKFSIGGISLPKIPSIPLMADGGTIARSGMAIVGESGAELINMPRGATVTPLTGGGVGGVSLNIYNPKFFNAEDIDNMMTPVVNRLKTMGIGGR